MQEERKENQPSSKPSPPHPQKGTEISHHGPKTYGEEKEEAVKRRSLSQKGESSKHRRPPKNQGKNINLQGKISASQQPTTPISRLTKAQKSLAAVSKHKGKKKEKNHCPKKEKGVNTTVPQKGIEKVPHDRKIKGEKA